VRPVILVLIRGRERVRFITALPPGALNLARLVRIDTLDTGTEFRFAEESRWSGFPYRVDPRGAKVAGVDRFARGERPVVILRKDGRYPRYGSVRGCFPVRSPDGSIRHWVVKADTEVLVPSWKTQFWYGVLTILTIAGALGSFWWFVGRAL